MSVVAKEYYSYWDKMFREEVVFDAENLFHTYYALLPLHPSLLSLGDVSKRSFQSGTSEEEVMDDLPSPFRP